MKVVSVVGARPQFIKAATVSRALAARSLSEKLIHTGQHYDANMSDVFFRELQIPRPDYQLGIGSGSHGMQTARMLEGIEPVLIEERPDWVIVYGDTNSTLAATLAAAKLHIPVAHVEAGLRSFNRRMPEEVNRVLTDHASSLLFAPTEAAVANLVREGVARSTVHEVGDVMYDAARYYAASAASNEQLLRSHGVEPGGYILATVHRAENTDDPKRLEAIFRALVAAAEILPVVIPLHPRTRKALESGAIEVAELTVIDPVGYLDMIALERSARLIATDSGGVQKEAYFHRVPCVTLREETEWVELLRTDWNRLARPDDADHILATILDSLDRQGASVELYGSGTAARRIADILAGSEVTGPVEARGRHEE